MRVKKKVFADFDDQPTRPHNSGPKPLAMQCGRNNANGDNVHM